MSRRSTRRSPPGKASRGCRAGRSCSRSSVTRSPICSSCEETSRATTHSWPDLPTWAARRERAGLPRRTFLAVPDTSFEAPDGRLDGYLATPPGSGPWPGVVVLHEIFGLTDDIRAQADRFAAAGYLALAPDLYAWSNTPRCLVATLRTLAAGSGRTLTDIDYARRYLAADPDCTGSVGVIGFCLGGGLAILASPSG